jgi:hypothetical protein
MASFEISTSGPIFFKLLFKIVLVNLEVKLMADVARIHASLVYLEAKLKKGCSVNSSKTQLKNPFMKLRNRMKGPTAKRIGTRN